MRYGAFVEEITKGDSVEVQVITMTSRNQPNETAISLTNGGTGGMWQLVFNDKVARRVRLFPTEVDQTSLAGLELGTSYEWGVSASIIESSPPSTTRLTSSRASCLSLAVRVTVIVTTSR